MEVQLPFISINYDHMAEMPCSHSDFSKENVWIFEKIHILQLVWTDFFLIFKTNLDLYGHFCG